MISYKPSSKLASRLSRTVSGVSITHDLPSSSPTRAVSVSARAKRHGHGVDTLAWMPLVATVKRAGSTLILGGLAAAHYWIEQKQRHSSSGGCGGPVAPPALAADAPAWMADLPSGLAAAAVPPAAEVV
eukprot:CAMPEP_0181172214 /NCGR_PEP_ID=MMETSP1096-20121128/2331_1 /TAXON_ID=156174 ORGANISM="Chrysochromulina ericina, Strain CCMP281" /NCGR_SAMPLE_ID=MMETSP1096 /ASSEMBLY_ACC=CAM_ASM_000453 /LENGTH=128 /DNA_ID=CAMNT_0023259929 /DNA_START=140 /DNA_END=527 /DNA_ORIENTATION=-